VSALSAEAKRILTFLPADEPTGPDDLIGKTGYPASSVLESLMELEMRGFVKRRGDALYVRL
jgi:predicted Rossmann fold nucleotide-binding protein DprA/Smf involved in DNA uptake